MAGRPSKRNEVKPRDRLPSGCLYVPLWIWLVIVVVIAVGWAAWKTLDATSEAYWGVPSTEDGQQSKDQPK